MRAGHLDLAVRRLTTPLPAVNSFIDHLPPLLMHEDLQFGFSPALLPQRAWLMVRTPPTPPNSRPSSCLLPKPPDQTASVSHHYRRFVFTRSYRLLGVHAENELSCVQERGAGREVIPRLDGETETSRSMETETTLGPRGRRRAQKHTRRHTPLVCSEKSCSFPNKWGHLLLLW